MGRRRPFVQEYRAYRRPPGLYRLARALRWTSTLVLVLLILFTGAVAYSAVLTAESGSSLGSIQETFANNGTVELATTLTLHNDGFFSVQGMTLSVRLTNASGTVLGADRVGPSTLARDSSSVVPIAVYFPLNGSVAGASLLTEDQSLPIAVWANATFGYLFPIGLALSTTRSWGAPFADLNVSVGAPTMGGGGASVPVTLTFQNHAPFSDLGTLQYSLVAVSGTSCGGGGFTINVPSGEPYSQTTSVSLSGGCSPADGSVHSSFTGPDYSVALPPEPIP